MLNPDHFGKRIQKIMNYYALSASGFADLMGVGRSSISHILSGRNKPSLDFVMKIVDAYAEVDLKWLLYGKGTFPISETKEEKNPNTPAILKQTHTPAPSINQDLFTNTPQIEDTTPNLNANTELREHNSDPSEIDKIVIFYKNGTFKQYVSKS